MIVDTEMLIKLKAFFVSIYMSIHHNTEQKILYYFLKKEFFIVEHHNDNNDNSKVKSFISQ